MDRKRKHKEWAEETTYKSVQIRDPSVWASLCKQAEIDKRPVYCEAEVLIAEAIAARKRLAPRATC